MNHFNMTCNCFETGDGFTIQKHFEQINYFDNVDSVITFRSTPSENWSGVDWIKWHTELLKAFQQGKFKSRIKYDYQKALELTNSVFNTWFKNKASFKVKNFAGYDTEFFKYFKSVGLENILSIFQAIYNPVAGATVKVAEGTEKVAEAVKGTTESLSVLGKWLPYIIIILSLVIIYFYFNSNKS